MHSIGETTHQLRAGTHTLEAIYNTIVSHGDAPSAQYDKNGEIRYITFSEYDRRVRHAAAGLQKVLGVPEKPQYIGIRMDNSPDYMTVFWGAIMAGYQPVLIDFRADAKQTEHIVVQTQAVAVIALDQVALPAGVHLLDPAPLLQDCDGQVRGGFANRVAMCTSGTTASSKVYVYDGQALTVQLLDFLALARTSPTFLNDKPHRVLAFLPFHHIFGFMTMMMAYTVFGKTIVFPKDRTSKSVQEACRLHQITHLFNVPLFWNSVAQKLSRAARQKGEDKERKLHKLVEGSIKRQRVFGKAGRKYYANLTYGIRKNLLGTHLSCGISGGGRILPDTLKLLNGISCPLVNGFGMTEVGITSVQVFDSIDDQLSGCVGRPMQSVKIKVKPREGDKPSVGELFIKSAAMHIGRMVNGELVPAELDEEGYFGTGDIARFELGKLWIEGRLKDVIINESGENVYPDELEDAFADIEEIQQVCAFGADFGGPYEDITLVVYAENVQRDRARMDALINALSVRNAQLPIYKRVRRCFFSLAALPLTASLKVKRVRVKEDLAAGRFDAIEVDLAKRRVCGSISVAGSEAEVEKSEAYLAILNKIKEFFAEELCLNVEDITDRAHFVYDLGGDSLASLGVFTKIEEHFKILITDDEYTSCTCAEDAALLLLSKQQGGKLGGKKRIATFEETPEWQALEARLKETEAMGNPYFVAHDSPLRDTSLIDGKEVINYGSYNYVCLSGHPRTVKAAQDAAEKYGTSASGSRLLAGEKTLHQELEKAIAEWKHTEAALVLVGGHSTNVTFVGNFCNERDLILYDALSHNSIVQGCQLSTAHTKGFPHNDYVALENILRANRDSYEKVLIVVEGAYSMDGDIAPVPEFVRIKKEYGCFLMVDEAHSSCVIGAHGGGVDEYFNLAPDDIDIKMGTLSKGLGTCGGYLAGKRSLIEYQRYNVPGFVFSVGLSPVLTAATLEGIRILQEDNALVTSLQQNIQDFMEVAHSYGFDTCLAGETAIAPILIGGDMDAFALSAELLKEGVFVPPAVYPAVPKGQARLRFCLTSAHKREQAEYALQTLDRLIKEHGFRVPRKAYQGKD